MLVYLVTEGFQMQIPRALALLAVATVLWLIAREGRPFFERDALLRTYRWPLAFCLLLVAGWWMLGGASAGLADEPLVPESQFVMVEGDETLEVEPTVNSDLIACVERGGLAVAPILALVALLWLLSKSSFAH